MLEKLYYQHHGRPIGNSPTLVLIHGLFGSSDNLSVIRRAFEDDYCVLSLDMPDHGLSPWSEKFSYENYAKQVILTLSDIGVSSASFVAHSLGGKVAMWIAHLQPSIIKHLVCLDIAPVAYEPRHHNVITGLTSIVLSSVESRKDAQTKLSKLVHDQGTQAFLLKSLFQDEEQWKWRFNLNLLVRDYPILSDWTLGNDEVYDGEVLFIKGSRSDYIRRDYQAAIIKQFPKAIAKIVDAGHWLHAEKPQIVNSLITKHLLGR